MGLYKELCSKNIESPDIEIAVVDGKYVMKNYLEVRIEKVEIDLNHYYFVVVGSNGEVFFKTEDKFFGKILSTVYNQPLINICPSSSGKVRRKIYFGESEEVLLGEIRKKDTLRGKKFITEFTRLGYGREAYLTLVCDKDMRICNIVYDNDNGYRRVVGKCVRSLFNRLIYDVEIAPGVDIVYIIGLMLFFVEETHNTKRKGYIGGFRDSDSE